jgi:hypothetical protein
MNFLLLAVLALLQTAAARTPGTDPRPGVADEVVKLTRDAIWKPAGTIPVQFVTHHPQGMVKIGDVFFVSSVEIKVPTKRFAAPTGGYDRDAGEGVGHLFKIDARGNLIADLRLGEGTIYHPGGIDYDGRSLWVPVAEYRPNSRAIVYRVDPERMQAEEVLRVADHIGAIVRDTDDGALHGVSWGSRRFYRWPAGTDGRFTAAGTEANQPRALNRSHYVDYQDCKYGGDHRMLCTGVTEIRPPGAAPFRLGGLDLVDLRDGRPLHQVPVLLWTAKGLDMTHNPVWLERAASGLRAYFMPEDDSSTIYVYEVETRDSPGAR